MLTTHRRDQRTRQQALFTLETLDDRLVLSAAAAGAAAVAAGAKAALVEQRHQAQIARHEARLARVQARHEARLAAAHPTSSAAIASPMNASATASATPVAASSSARASSPAAVTTSGASATSSPSSPRIPANSTTSGPNSPTSSSPSPLPANVAGALQSLYAEFQSAGSGTFKPSQPTDNLLQISGTSVAVDLKIGSGADFNTALSQLKSDGLQVTSSSSSYGLIDGMLPISQLPAASQIASSVNPSPAPHLL